MIVQGISQKGKNRVREHGNSWKIKQITPKSVLLESILTKYLRWMNLDNDPDFVKVKDE